MAKGISGILSYAKEGVRPVSYTPLPCRLKDVNELFDDTGIAKEGYSIIGQGQIDKILSGKPEERRELFDEAAGIVKFKKRKNMSVKKLEEERPVSYTHLDVYKRQALNTGSFVSSSEASSSK